MNNPLLNPDILQWPYPTISRLQKSQLFYCDQLGGYVVTRYHQVREALSHPLLIAGGLDDQVYNILGEQFELAKDYLRIRNKMMLHRDGAQQARLRRPCLAAFSRKHIPKLSPIINQAIYETMAELPLEGFDFCTQVAEPFSTRVIAGLFGVPDSLRESFQKDSDDVSRFFGSTMGDPVEDAKIANQAICSLEKTFIKLIEQRPLGRMENLLDSFLALEQMGKLNRDEVIAQSILIMMAGHYTVIDQLSNSLFHLIDQGLWEKLSRRLDLLPNAIEETIRYDGGVLFMGRNASKDFLWNGIELKRGQTVFLGLGAANRDPSIFENPEKIDLFRQSNPHLGFGAGPHQCLGAELGRYEMHSLLAQMIKSFPHLKIEKAKRKCESLFFRGFYHIDLKVISPADGQFH